MKQALRLPEAARQTVLNGGSPEAQKEPFS